MNVDSDLKTTVASHKSAQAPNQAQSTQRLVYQANTRVQQIDN
ncbi:hypothetical protein [Paenibacillus alginolyticus]|nr:hypothetical protein [Paenibacillus alginolyticus]